MTSEFLSALPALSNARRRVSASSGRSSASRATPVEARLYLRAARAREYRRARDTRDARDTPTAHTHEHEHETKVARARDGAGASRKTRFRRVFLKGDVFSSSRRNDDAYASHITAERRGDSRPGGRSSSRRLRRAGSRRLASGRTRGRLPRASRRRTGSSWTWTRTRGRSPRGSSSPQGGAWGHEGGRCSRGHRRSSSRRHPNCRRCGLGPRRFRRTVGSASGRVVERRAKRKRKIALDVTGWPDAADCLKKTIVGLLVSLRGFCGAKFGSKIGWKIGSPTRFSTRF